MAEANHAARKHALLSASGASRWLNCTPSARLEEKKPNRSSIYADEGTLAHEYSDINIQYRLGMITEKVFNSEIKKLQKHKLYSSEIDTETAKYIDTVMETYAEVIAKDKHAIILVEQRLDFSHIVEHGFGTGDIVIISNGVMYVIDLKYGKGVKVTADDNSQLKLYGVGALREFELSYDIHTVRLVIAQPRMDNWSTWDISAEDLNDWAENFVKPKAKEAYKGEGDQTPGEWCKFCKVKNVCRALAEKNLELAKYEFRDPHELSVEELSEIYDKLDMYDDWSSSIKKYMLDEAIRGTKFNGFKLVEGRSNRKWLDEDKVIKKLSNNFDEDEYMNSKLKGIGDIEKLVGKVDFAKDYDAMVVKPQGAPALVPESDKRPELGLNSAKNDFSEDDG